MAEIVAGAVLGVLFTELYKDFKEMKDDTKRFDGELEILDRTLDSLKPLIFEQLRELNLKLDLPTSEIEDIERKMREGKELLGRVSQIRKREYFFVKGRYRNQLVELNRSLKVLLDRLELQQARDVRSILFEMRM